MRCLFVAICLFAWQVSAQEASDVNDVKVRVSQIEVIGVDRTDEAWLLDYLEIKLPTSLSSRDVFRLRAKLMTTEVFTAVHMRLDRAVDLGRTPVSDHRLIIEIEEKWTTIPVIRAAYGGGTPLTVLGVYDTHVLGRLWTFGAQTMRYGKSPTGGVIWARAPRWLTGKHAVGVELWREFRERTIYDTHTAHKLGVFRSQSVYARGSYMSPLPSIMAQRDSNWQWGAEVQLRRKGATEFNSEDEDYLGPTNIKFSESPSREGYLMPVSVYDAMYVEGELLNGRRHIFKAGPLVDESGNLRSRAETEHFYFRLFPGQLNLATHLFMGDSTSRSLESQFFLGGFDSVRGYPDGIAFGNKMLYGNVELRKQTLSLKYAKIYSVVFTDAGYASSDWDDLKDRTLTSAGAGLRIAVPQVYRLTFRIDYAWGLSGTRSHGITAGLNQFFQPYRPL